MYICVYICVYISVYICVYIVMLVTVVESNLKAPFTIASYSKVYQRVRLLSLLHFTFDTYLIILSVKQGGIKYYFLSLWYDNLGLNPGLTGHWWTLYLLSQYIYFCVFVYIYMCICICLYMYIYIYAYIFYIYISCLLYIYYIYIYIVMWHSSCLRVGSNRFLGWAQPVGWPSLKAGQRDWMKFTAPLTQTGCWEPITDIVIWTWNVMIGWKAPHGKNSSIHVTEKQAEKN